MEIIGIAVFFGVMVGLVIVAGERLVNPDRVPWRDGVTDRRLIALQYLEQVDPDGPDTRALATQVARDNNPYDER